jgi:hypothetical protein
VNIFKLWMRAATPDEQELMAQAIGTSRGMLYQISGGHATVSAERGILVERTAARMHRESKGRLPLIYRTDLVEACRGCDFAQKCLGNRAVRADFPVVTEEDMRGECDE